MKVLHSPLPLLLLMLLWAVCSVSQVQADVKPVRLCGREFFRALVYTCGGSRWRRMLTPQSMEGFSNGELSSSELLGESEGLELHTRDDNRIMYNECCQRGCKKSDLTPMC